MIAAIFQKYGEPLVIEGIVVKWIKKPRSFYNGGGNFN